MAAVKNLVNRLHRPRGGGPARHEERHPEGLGNFPLARPFLERPLEMMLKTRFALHRHGESDGYELLRFRTKGTLLERYLRERAEMFLELG